MAVSRSNFARTRFGTRKPEPVGGEPEIALGLPEHFQRNAAAAERDARAAGRMGYDDGADHLDWYGVTPNWDYPTMQRRPDPAYLARAELYPRIAKDNRAYTVVSVVLALVLGMAVTSVGLAAYLSRPKPVAVERMPIEAPAWRCFQSDGKYRCE